MRIEKQSDRTDQNEDGEWLNIIEMERKRMYGIAYAYLRNQADALEAIQETVCRVWMKRHTVRELQYRRTWMIRILIRVCMDTRKKKRRELPSERTADRVAAEGEAAAGERLDMAAAVEELPPKYRMVIVLKYYRDMTITDIAQLLEKPDGTIRTWLNKALKQLRISHWLREGGVSHEQAMGREPRTAGEGD
ncbi:sigma-70 family RNA polymerase sigma factor [Paenibacillus sp. GCM10023252]|uniref:sigma-70 family RNA polymerase sigma factor n=1 Tax=Paenibacillus sp. GCM10023252 TaxID=3252649 RepID=UPI003606C2F1